MLKVAPVSTKYLSFVSSSVMKMSPALAGRCIALAVACAGLAENGSAHKHRVEHTCEPCWRDNYEICTRHCQGSERNGNLGGRGADFWSGRYRPFVASLSAVRCRAPASLSRGGRDCRVVAASSIPQGIRGLHHGSGCHVVASTYCLTHGWWQVNKKHGQKKIIVWRNTGGWMLF